MPFEPWTILLCIIAAFLVGIGKTDVPGLGLIAIPLMAFAFPAKESVGVLLLLLIVGDIFAVIYYRQRAKAIPEFFTSRWAPSSCFHWILLV